MFNLIIEVFIVLLSFSSSLATKFMSLDDEPDTVRSTVFD